MLGKINDMLVYDTETRIVYWKFVEDSYATPYHNGWADNHCTYKFETGYMSPYIGPNGKYCRYIDDNVVEI